jgi:hypothetical protein
MRPGAMSVALRSVVDRIAMRRLFLLLCLAAGIGACGLLPPDGAPVDLDAPLVTYESTGGECPQGACGFTAEIYRDGRVVRSDGMNQVADEASIARLVEQVEAADWDTILATPFEGECPRNFDGQEETYTFHVLPAPVIVASCTVLVDHQEEPFATVQGILFGVGG